MRLNATLRIGECRARNAAVALRCSRTYMAPKAANKVIDSVTQKTSFSG